MTVSELEYFEVGGVLDIAAEYVKETGTDVRYATQSDFDSF